MVADTQHNNLSSFSEEQIREKKANENVTAQKKSAGDKILSILKGPLAWGLSASLPFLISAYLNKTDPNIIKLSNQTEELWKRTEQLSKKTDQVIDQTKKDSDPTYPPYTAPDIIPDSIARLHTRIATTNINDIILKKGGLDKIPHTISYTVGGQKKHIDITQYLDSLNTDSLFVLMSLDGNNQDVSASISQYCEKDYHKYKPLLQKISSERVGITPKDSYRDKVAKIQKFVHSFPYEYDKVYLGRNGMLSAISDYQLPFLANILIGKMDCNNKTGLFIELCRINNIISGMGINSNHSAPAVFSDSNDEVREYALSNISISKKGKGSYNGIVVDPTGSLVLDGEKKIPRLAGYLPEKEAYDLMKFTIFWPK